MMLKALVLIAGLAAVAAQTDVQGTLGVDTMINSGVDTRIAFGVGLTHPSLRITATTSGGGQVTVRMSAQSTLALTGGWSSVSVGGTVGFSLVISGASTVTIGSLTLTGPGLTPTLITQITTGGYIAGVVQWSADASAVVNLPIMQQPSLSSPNIVVQLPKVLSATYAFVSIQQTVAVPYGVVRECYAEANQTMTYTQSTAVELAVTFRARASSQLLIGRSTTSSTSASSRTEAGKSLGVYFNITLMGSASVNEYHDSEIRYYYTDAQCEAAGITAAMQAHLRLAYYNAAQARWVFPAGGRCDTQAKVVIQATSHFSEWGVFYNSAASTACSFALALAAAFLAMLAQ